MNAQLQPPEERPFFWALCWQGGDPDRFSPEEQLAIYERGWKYLNVLAELGPEERLYLRRLAQAFGSWIRV